VTVIKRISNRRVRSRTSVSLLPKFFTAAVLSAAVLLSTAATAQAQGSRVPAGPANMFRPGTVFTYYTGTADPGRLEGLNAALNTMTAQNAQTAGRIANARAGIQNGIAAADPDTLVRTVLTSIEETFPIVVQAGSLRAIQQTNPSFGDMLTTAQMGVVLPDGASLQVLLATAIHSLNVAAAGEKLRGGATHPDITRA